MDVPTQQGRPFFMLLLSGYGSSILILLVISVLIILVLPLLAEHCNNDLNNCDNDHQEGPAVNQPHGKSHVLSKNECNHGYDRGNQAEYSPESLFLLLIFPNGIAVLVL